jgi:L-glyceraldehyde 3-phosphate reductase
MSALDFIVRSGRALYAGISTYSPAETREAARILKELGTPCLIHQPRYNMFDRWIEDGLLDVLDQEGIGCIPFSPLCQGILTNKYIDQIPEKSRAAKYSGQLYWGDSVTDARVSKVIKLHEIAKARGQNMAQLAVAWVLRSSVITSALIGASRPEQIVDIVNGLQNLELSDEELQKIEGILAE